MAKTETNNQYLDASPSDFSDKVQQLLAQERGIYDMLKAAKAEVLAALKAEMQMPQGKEVKHTAFTRWGQWQIVIGDKAVAKATSARQSLADYLAAQVASGART